jgi:membrane associated rhomboid family serine protease
MRRVGGGLFGFQWTLTNWIIAVTVAFYLVFWLVIAFLPAIQNYFVLTPALVISDYRVWTLLTSMFLHANFVHLFVNMFSLFFLGRVVEQIIGRKRYFWFYLVAGIAGALFFIGGAYLAQYIFHGDMLFGSPMTAAVGASGALFGLLGLLAMLIPSQRVYLIVGPLVLIVGQVILGSFLPANVNGVLSFIISFLFIFMLIGMFSGNVFLRRIAMPVNLPLWLAPIVAIVPLFVISFFVALPIGNTAHIGGLVAGLIYGAYLRKRYSRKVAMLGRAFRR